MKKLFIAIIALLCLFSQNICAKEAVTYLYDDYYKILDEEDKILGERYITRGEFIAVLMNSFSYTSDIYLCSFSDVYEYKWDYKYIAAAQNKGITVGDGANAFKSDDYLKAQDAVVFLSRAYKLDKLDMGEYDSSAVENTSQYSKNFVGYAVYENIYPEENGKYIQGNDKISVEAALMLIDKYKELSQIGFGSVKFSEGFPKLQTSGLSNSLLVELKTDKPCVVYYKMIENNWNSYVPITGDVNEFLTPIANENTKVSVNIELKQKKSYDIFFVLESSDGKKSGVYSLKNVSVLPFTIGNGTKDNPYRIYSKYQFEQIRNYPDKCFLLCEDIEYNDSWIPIGSMSGEKKFSGVLDGGGHSVTGIKIDVEDNAGLFSVIDAATIKNLYVDAEVTGKNNVGIIAGVSNEGSISNCHTSGEVIAKENIAGGIVGKNSGEVNNCVSAVYSVEANSYAGGISGVNYNKIKNCISAVERVSAGMYSASVSGVNSGGVIENCVGASMEAADDISIKTGRITTNKENGKIINCYAYSQMLSGDNIYIGENLQDGAEVSWESLTMQSFYENNLGWDFSRKWTIKNAPEFMLPLLKNVKKPDLVSGINIYAPKKISNEQELTDISKKLDGHYYLANDINLRYLNTSEKYWCPLGVSDEYGNLVNTFSGTLDGQGHTIRNLRLDYSAGTMQNGLFGVIYGGSVRNLKIENVSGNVKGTVGIVAGVNYGLIENCYTDGELDVYDRNSESVIGGICAINYTNILSCNSKLNINADTESASLGGISGTNEGFIFDCSHKGRIKSIQGGRSSNTVIGGISGSNYSGFIYNSYANNTINSNSNAGYVGGIVGMMSGGEVYKSHTDGIISFESQKKNSSNSYVGGICGILSNALIMNSYSRSNIFAKSDTSYAGGIAGFIENSSVQNVYSNNLVNQTGNAEIDKAVYAGGIAGYSDNSNVSGSVAINSQIITNGICGEICAYSNGGYTDNNYSSDSINIIGSFGENSINAIKTEEKILKDTDFYFKPIYSGGSLGWDNTEFQGDVWTKSRDRNYKYPVLYEVKY